MARSYNTPVIILWLLSVLLIQLGRSVPFSTETFVVGGPGFAQEMDIAGSVLQSITIPEGYTCPTCNVHLDDTGTQLILPLSTGADGAYTLYAYTVNSNGEFVDVTSVSSSSIIKDAAINGQDVFFNYFDGIAYAKRGATSATSNNILANTLPKIKYMALDNNQIGVIWGANNYGEIQALPGPVLLPYATILGTTFWKNYPFLYMADALNSMTKYQYDPDTGDYTKLYSADCGASVLGLTGIMYSGKQFIVFIVAGNSLSYFYDTGGALSGPVQIGARGSYTSIVTSPKATCTDNLKNQDETDVDCGGSICSPCIGGKSCATTTDCISRICDSGICAITCNDTLKNQDETDADCGGNTCSPCGINRTCQQGSDCISNYCNPNNVCSNPSCNDGFKNRDETDEDCGGMICDACTAGSTCNLDLDCLSPLACVSGICMNDGSPVVPPMDSPVTSPSTPINVTPSEVQTPITNNSPGVSAPTNSAPQSTAPTGSSPISSTPSRKVSAGVTLECSMIIGLIFSAVVILN